MRSGRGMKGFSKSPGVCRPASHRHSLYMLRCSFPSTGVAYTCYSVFLSCTGIAYTCYAVIGVFAAARYGLRTEGDVLVNRWLPGRWDGVLSAAMTLCESPTLNFEWWGCSLFGAWSCSAQRCMLFRTAC